MLLFNELLCLNGMQAGEGVLSLSFAGQLNDRMKGFYRCKYTTSDGEVRYGASTQFEVFFVSLKKFYFDVHTDCMESNQKFHGFIL